MERFLVGELLEEKGLHVQKSKLDYNIVLVLLPWSNPLPQMVHSMPLTVLS
jgi:hypothetical protein